MVVSSLQQKIIQESSENGDSNELRLGGALLNVLIILGIIVVMTCVLVYLYIYKVCNI